MTHVELTDLRMRAAHYDRMHNEGRVGGYNPYRDQLGEINWVEYEGGGIDVDEWTIETTKARRAEWGAWVQSMAVDGRVDTKAVIEKQLSQGWGIQDLKRAVEYYDL